MEEKTSLTEVKGQDDARGGSKKSGEEQRRHRTTPDDVVGPLKFRQCSMEVKTKRRPEVGDDRWRQRRGRWWRTSEDARG